MVIVFGISTNNEQKTKIMFFKNIGHQPHFHVMILQI